MTGQVTLRCMRETWSKQFTLLLFATLYFHFFNEMLKSIVETLLLKRLPKFLFTIEKKIPGLKSQRYSALNRLFQRFDVFTADSEDMKSISAVSELIISGFLWIRAVHSWKFQRWTARFQRESALNQRCSALIFLALNSWVFNAEQRWFSADLFWISSNINTCWWEQWVVIT